MGRLEAQYGDSALPGGLDDSPPVEARHLLVGDADDSHGAGRCSPAGAQFLEGELDGHDA